MHDLRYLAVTELMLIAMSFISGLVIVGVVALVIFNGMLWFNWLLIPPGQKKEATAASLCGCVRRG